MNASTILARRAATVASRRLSTRFLTTTAANETAASTSAPTMVGKTTATNRMMHYRRCGGPARGVAKVGVLALAGYGAYQLVFKPNQATAATTTGAVVDTTNSST